MIAAVHAEIVGRFLRRRKLFAAWYAVLKAAIRRTSIDANFEPSPTDPYHVFLTLEDLEGMLS